MSILPTSPAPPYWSLGQLITPLVGKLKFADTVPAEKLPLASRATTLLAVLAEVASTDIVTGTVELNRFTLPLVVLLTMLIKLPLFNCSKVSGSHAGPPGLARRT
jgi:hypothetical protein